MTCLYATYCPSPSSQKSYRRVYVAYASHHSFKPRAWKDPLHPNYNSRRACTLLPLSPPEKNYRRVYFADESHHSLRLRTWTEGMHLRLPLSSRIHPPPLPPPLSPPPWSLVWEKDFPKIVESLLKAAEATGAVLVWVDNLYMFGPEVAHSGISMKVCGTVQYQLKYRGSFHL